MKTLYFAAVLSLAANMAFADGHLADAPASLIDVNDRFNALVVAGDADGLTGMYADDTLWIEQGKRVKQGLDSPRALFDFMTANEGNVTHTIDHLFVSDDETLAVMIGSVEAVVESVGMDATGTYLFVLSPEDDDWEIVTDMWHQHVDE